MDPRRSPWIPALTNATVLFSEPPQQQLFNIIYSGVLVSDVTVVSSGVGVNVGVGGGEVGDSVGVSVGLGKGVGVMVEVPVGVNVGVSVGVGVSVSVGVGTSNARVKRFSACVSTVLRIRTRKVTTGASTSVKSHS